MASTLGVRQLGTGGAQWPVWGHTAGRTKTRTQVRVLENLEQTTQQRGDESDRSRSSFAGARVNILPEGYKEALHLLESALPLWAWTCSNMLQSLHWVWHLDGKDTAVSIWLRLDPDPDTGGKALHLCSKQPLPPPYASLDPVWRADSPWELPCPPEELLPKHVRQKGLTGSSTWGSDTRNKHRTQNFWATLQWMKLPAKTLRERPLQNTQSLRGRGKWDEEVSCGRQAAWGSWLRGRQPRCLFRNGNHTAGNATRKTIPAWREITATPRLRVWLKSEQVCLHLVQTGGAQGQCDVFLGHFYWLIFPIGSIITHRVPVVYKASEICGDKIHFLL